MTERFRNKYRITSTRLQNWDYSWNASYFITICTKNREHFFGEINNGEMVLSDIGKFADHFWSKIPDHFPYIILDAFVVMPDHIHGIIIIDNPNNWNVKIQNTNQNTEVKQTKGEERFQNQGKNTISSIIGSYKSVVSKNSRKIETDFGWQPRFYDHIIRDEKSFKRIQNYINNNPKNWHNG